MLTRKMLVAMDIPAEKIDEIINAHTETVNALKEERDSYKQNAEKYTVSEKELQDAKTKLEELSKDNSKEKLEALQKEFDDYKNNIEMEKVKETKLKVYTDAIKKAGITTEQGISKILKYTKLDDIEVEDGKLAKEQDVIKSIKNEWGELIVSQSGASTPTPPANNGGDTFGAMPLDKKMKYANEHPDDIAVREWLK